MSANFKIKNFQAIKDADIDADGFTILVGESSQGKSACLRAINAACNNKFKQNFLRHGADTISVTIDYNEGTTLEVTKTKKESPTYKLKDLVFQKLNRTVPQEINNFNNYGIIDYFEQKYPLNYFSQFAKPLLLEFSQKRILEILSSSKAYDDMNIASTNLNKHKEQNNGAFKQLSIMLSDNKNQLSELKKQYDLLYNHITTMRQLTDDIDTKEKSVKATDDILTELNIYDKETLKAVKNTAVVDVCVKLQEKNNIDNKCNLLLSVIDDNKNANNLLLLKEKITSDCKILIDKQDVTNYINNLITLLNNSIKDKNNLKVLNARLQVCNKIKDMEQKIASINYHKFATLCDLINQNIVGKQQINALDKRFKLSKRIIELKANVSNSINLLNKVNTIIDTINITKTNADYINKKAYIINNRICPICGKPL